MAERTDTRRRALIATAAGMRHEALGGQEWGLLAAAATIWGSSFPFIEIGLEHFGPGLIAWARVDVGRRRAGRVAEGSPTSRALRPAGRSWP